MNERPSISRIVTTDYIAFIGFLVPIVSAAMLAILVLLQSENTTAFAWIAPIIAITAFGVLTWRIRLINTVFEDGIAALITTDRILCPFPRSYFHSAEDWDRFIKIADFRVKEAK